MILVAHARSEPLYFALLLHLGCLVCQIGELGAYSAGGGVGQACDREQHTGGSGRSLREPPRASSYAPPCRPPHHVYGALCQGVCRPF
jgi:hypothetical protein